MPRKAERPLQLESLFVFLRTLILPLAFGFISQVPVRASFELVAWGSDGLRQLRIPSAATNIVACAAGENHSLALRSDGTVFAWGSNSDGQIDFPGSPRPITAIAAGQAHSLALRDDGKLIAWGRPDRTTIPRTVTNIMAIAAGTSHSVALSKDGRITIWGIRGDGGAFAETILSPKADAVAASFSGTFIRDADGWRFSGRGNVWRIARRIMDSPFPPISVSVGLTERIIRSRSQIVPIGYVLSSNGELFSTFHTKTPLASDVRLFAAFETNGLVLFNDGRNLGWGNQKLAKLPQELRKAVAISIGRDHGVALIPNRPEPVLLVSPGRSIVSQGDPYTPFVRIIGDPPFSIQWFVDGLPIVNATNQSPVIWPTSEMDNAEVSVVVSNAAGSITSAPVTITSSPVKQWGNMKLKGLPTPVAGARPVRVFAGPYHAAIVNEDGTVTCWGKNSEGQCGVPLAATNILQVALGMKHSMALRKNGSIVVWGSDSDGQSSVPLEASDCLAVAAGYSHSVALRRDKRLVAWGNNEFGQLNIPLGLDNVIGVYSGAFHTLALREDRSVVSWGLESEVPEFATNIIRAAAGFRHSLALRADGSVVAWGDNSAGQCEVPNLSRKAIDIAAGYQHSMALLENGEVVTWGRAFLPNPGLMRSGGMFDEIAAAEELSLAVRLNHLPGLIRLSGRNHASVGSTIILAPEMPLPFRAKFQWYHDGTPITDATNSVLSLTPLDPRHSGNYQLSVSDEAESVQSEIFPVVVTESASIETHYQHTNHPPNLALSLRVQVAGSSPLKVQWFKNGIPLVDGQDFQGVSTTELRISKPMFSESGRYSVAARNDQSSVTNDVWNLTVTPIVVWGETSLGQDRVPAHAAVPIQVTAGANHTLALIADRTVLAWGENSQGQCLVPLQADSRTVCIASGENHNLALLDGGEILAWGDNTFGQCNVPTGMSNIAFVVASGNRSGLVTRDGEISIWGGNQSLVRIPSVSGGILGIAFNQNALYAITAADSTVVGLTLPPYFMPLTTGRAMALTGLQNLGISYLGGQRKVVAWGYAANGELSVPGDLVSPVAVAAGGFTSMALTAERRVHSWGRIDWGWPSIPPLATNVVQIARGYDHAVALRHYDEPPIEITSLPLKPQAGASAELVPAQGIQNWDAFAWTQNGVSTTPSNRPSLKFVSTQWRDRGTYQLTVARGPLSVASPPYRFDPEQWIFAANGAPILTNSIELIGPNKISFRNVFDQGFAFMTTDGSDPVTSGRLISGDFELKTDAELRCIQYNHDFSDFHVAAGIHIALPPYATVSATTQGGGTVTTLPAGPYFKLGSRIRVTAKPSIGWEFLEWRNQSRGFSESIEVDVRSDAAYEAVFGSKLRVQTIGSGSIFRSPILDVYPFGSSVQITAIPNAGIAFLGWDFPDPSHSPRTNILVNNSEIQVRAIFGSLGRPASLLNASTHGPGRLEVEPDKAEYLPGDLVTLTAVPWPGADFVEWEGVASTTNSVLSLRMDASRRIVAHFVSRREVSIHPVFAPDGVFVVTKISGSPGDVYHLDRSPDFLNWGDAQVWTNWTGTVVVSDYTDEAPARFIRVQ